MLFRSISKAIFLALPATLVIGCGGGPKLLPVSGVVTLDGQPVADAGVMFVPTVSGPVGTGTTDAAGRFRLSTTNQSGVLAGAYRVAISKRESVGKDPANASPASPTKNIVMKWVAPQKYATGETSGLEATVSPDQHEFTFALTSR